MLLFCFLALIMQIRVGVCCTGSLWLIFCVYTITISKLMLIWQQVMSWVMCFALRLRHERTHPLISQSICLLSLPLWQPVEGHVKSDRRCMCSVTSFKAVTVWHSVSSQMPQCTHLSLKRTLTKTRTLPACRPTWVTAARWWMVSCMCTQQGALWKSEMFVMNHSEHACFYLLIPQCGRMYVCF